MACQIDCPFINETIIITKQKTLTATVSAFFSEKYFFMYRKYYGGIQVGKNTDG